MFSEEDLDTLRDPRVTLPSWGKIMDQRTGQQVLFDPDRIAPSLQHSILSFYGETPRTKDGRKKWLLALASRQSGKSLTAGASTYVKAAYTPGSYSAMIADTKERAEDLFRAVLILHNELPDEIRMPTIPNRESRQLTFLHLGKFRTLSADAGAVGIGRAVDNLHMSELPFWDDPGDTWNGIYPAIANRDEASVLMESTPAPMTYGGASWYRDMCSEARRGMGRWLFTFMPFFQSSLNERVWDKNTRVTQEEQRLLDLYGPRGDAPESCPGAQYLTLENLAFRRETMDMDPEVRRDPEKFFVYYPVDTLTCWKQGGGAVLSRALLARHETAVLVPWRKNDTYKEYKSPNPDAIYVLGADPAGWLGGDSAAFQILEVWEDRIEQVAVFSSNEVTPEGFADTIITAAKRYNDALVGVESNGVGLATLTLLVAAQRAGKLKHLLFQDRGIHAKPGIPATAGNISRALGLLIDGLQKTLVLHDMETVEQLSTYRNDKLVQEGETREVLMPGKTAKGRRPKHHWDRCSALLWAMFMVPTVPLRIRKTGTKVAPTPPAPTGTPTLSALTWNQRLAYDKLVQKDKKKRRPC